jgi:HK97 family phage portal protein
MSIRDAVARFFNPAPPAIQTRAELLGLDQRSAAGLTLFTPSQINRPVWQTGTTQRYVAEGYNKAPVVFACTLAIADAVATAPIVVVQTDGNGETTPATDSDLQRLLNRPNPSMDQAEFMQAVSVIAALSGFCVIEKERNALGQIVALWPLRSDWVRPIPREQSAPAWEYRVPGRQTPLVLEPEDVAVHTHAPDPNMGYMGTAPMAVAFRELGIENAMTDFLKAFFDRGALPVYGIIPKTQITNQEQADAFRQRLVGRYGGALRSAEPMLLTGVEDVKRLGFDFDELAYPQLRSLSETSICTAYRVPPMLIGVQAGLDASTYSNYKQAIRFFYETAIVSLWRRLDGALSRSLVPEYDDTGTLSIEFDTGAVSALQDDENALWARATAALQARGISTHTFQRIIGVEPHGDDVFLQSFSTTPVPVSDGRQRSRMTGRVEPLAPKSLPQGRSVRAMAYDSEEHRQRWEQRLTLTERWEQRFAEGCSALMEEQRQDVQAGLVSGGRSVREIDITEPFDREAWVGRFAVTMRPIVQNIITEQAQLAADEVGYTIAFDVQDPNVIRAMERQLQRFAESVNDTTWDALKASLAEGINAGEGIGQLAERVDAVMIDRIRSSKEVIARTEVNQAANSGTYLSWSQSGVVKGKQWLAALDDRTRQSHVEAHGQIVGLDENFSVGGASGPYPGAMGRASEDVQCRCSMVPVLDTDALEGQP